MTLTLHPFELAARSFELRNDARPRWRSIARPEQLPPTGSWLTWLILAGRGWGKALALDTPLPTPTGWTTMGDVRVGDQLLDERGEPCTVTYGTEVQLNRQCYLVKFDDGSSIVADADHLWFTWDKAARKAHGRATDPTLHPQTRMTREIADTLTVQGGRERNHSIRNALPLQLSAVDLPVDPYVLGAWLGDGTSKTSEITIGDGDAEETLGYLAAAGEPVSGPVRRKPGAGCATYPIGGHTARKFDSLHSRLKGLGVLNNKHIPIRYLRASEDQRRALLQGLMDTDGSVQHGGHVEFLGANYALTRDVFELAVTLGAKPTILDERATLRGRDCGPRWRVSWTTDEPVFRLARKRAKLRTATAQATRTRHRYIVACEPFESTPVRCIQVSSPSHLFLAGRAMIPTHNTRTCAEAMAEDGRRYPGMRGALVAARFADARDTLVEGLAGLLDAFAPSELKGGSRDKAWNRSLGELSLANGTQYKVFSSEKPNQLRGPEHHRAWCDEIAKWDDAKIGMGTEAGQETTWSNLLFGMRGQARPNWPSDYRPRIYASTTPKPVRLLEIPPKELAEYPERAGLLQLPSTAVTRGRTSDNVANLDETYISTVIAPLVGTRLGRQELDAEMLRDVQGAYLSSAQINESMLLADQVPQLAGIVVSVDPATTKKATSDETGIVVSGVDGFGEGYVLDDVSGRYTPEEWGRRAWKAAFTHEADAIVVEDNQGGDMCAHVLENAYRAMAGSPAERASLGVRMRPVPIVRVRSTANKWLRGLALQPRFDQGRIHFVHDPTNVSALDGLIDQACAWTGEDGEPDDRVDGMIQGLTWLLLPRQRAEKGTLAPAKPRTAAGWR